MFSRFFFNRVPWWVFGSMFTMSVPLTGIVSYQAFHAQSVAESVENQPPPHTILLENFDYSKVANVYGETRISGVFNGVEGPFGDDEHFVLIEPQSGIGAHVILVDKISNRDETLIQLRSQTGSDGRLTLTGFVRDDRATVLGTMTDTADVKSALLNKNIQPAETIYQIDPYWGDRPDALSMYRIDKWGISGVAVILTLMLGFVTRMRWRIRRAKVLERKRIKAEQKEAAWVDSPIQTAKGGWFGR